MKQYVSGYVDHLLDSWMCDQFPIEQFPGCVVEGADHTELLVDHAPHLLYKLLLYKKEAIEPLASVRGSSMKLLLTANMPTLLARFTPSIIQTVDNPATLEQIEPHPLSASLTAYKVLSQTVDEAQAQSCLAEHVATILLVLLRTAHFPKELYPGNCTVHPQLSHLTQALVNNYEMLRCIFPGK